MEIDEVTKINTSGDFVNNESNTDNTKVISADQKSLWKTSLAEAKFSDNIRSITSLLWKT